MQTAVSRRRAQFVVDRELNLSIARSILVGVDFGSSCGVLASGNGPSVVHRFCSGCLRGTASTGGLVDSDVMDCRI